jgi:hypothetical protein
MKIDFNKFPVIALLKSLFTDANKAQVSGITDEIRRLFLYGLSHWYVLVSLAMMSVPLIIMSAGKDIAYGLFDNQLNSFLSSFSFVVEFCWVLLLFALICWRLPIHYLADKYLTSPADAQNASDTEGSSLLNPMRQKVYRFNGFLAFALMIAWILSFAKVHLRLLDIGGIIVYVLSLWKFAQVFAHHLEKQRQKWKDIVVTDGTSFFKLLRKKNPLIAAFLPCLTLALVLLAVAVWFSYKRNDEWNYFVLAGSLGFTAVLFYVFADFIDRIAIEKRPTEHLNMSLRTDAGVFEKFIQKIFQGLKKPFTWFVYLFVMHETRADLADNSWKKPFFYIHVFCFVHVLLATFFFCLVPNMSAIHPVFCILYGVSFVVFVLDWLNYVFYRKYYVFARWSLIGLGLLFLAMVGFAIAAKMKGEPINYFSGGLNLVLLFVTIKWLRFPNMGNFAKLNSGEIVDTSMLSPDVLRALEADNQIVMNDDGTHRGILPDNIEMPKPSWFAQPIHFLSTKELPVFGIGLICLLIVNLLMPNAATHDLALLNHGNEKPQMPKLATPRDYITGWLDNRRQALGTDSFDVYIVAGQGGGSRGAYWFSKIMTEMDAITEGSFRQQCLAMSTVSGSSVGGQSIVALWNSVPYSLQNNTNILSKFSHNAFQHNLLSGNLADVFFKDNIAAFWTSTGSFNPLTLGRGDRNHRLQREEAVRIEEAMQGGDQPVDGYSSWSILKAFKLKSLTNCPTNAPFWSFYYDYATNKPLYKVPLFFPNTCQVQGGKRSFVSPVQNDTSIFINTFDLTSRLIRNSKSISLTSAANLSELFPYLSMSSRLVINDIDNIETNFVDGGYYENYGLTTAYELIHFCADSLKILPQYKHIRLHLIAIINSQDAVADNTIQGINQITAPVQAIMGATFGGHANHILLEMRAKSRHEDFSFYEIQLPYTDDKSAVPLSRMLSFKSMAFMDKMVDSMRLTPPIKGMKK